MRQPFYRIEQICLQYHKTHRRIYLVEIGTQQTLSCIVQVNQLCSVKSIFRSEIISRLVQMISLQKNRIISHVSDRKMGLPLSDKYRRLQW